MESARSSIIVSSDRSTQQRKSVFKRTNQNDQKRFDLKWVKDHVIKDLNEQHPSNVRQFLASPLFDEILNICTLYFNAKFQRQCLNTGLERARKHHIEEFNPLAVSLKLVDLEEEQNRLKMSLSPLYAQVILKYSAYKHQHKDRQFFEHLYEALILIIDSVYGTFKQRAEIEHDIGLLFRSRHFNLYQRKNAPPRSLDTLTVREVYAVKHETENRSLNAKLISSLYNKPKTLAVQAASVTTSPLISQYIASPIVARCIIKDPQLRNEMFSSTVKSKQKGSNKPGSLTPAPTMARGTSLGRGESATLRIGANGGTGGNGEKGDPLQDEDVRMLEEIKRCILRSEGEMEGQGSGEVVYNGNGTGTNLSAGLRRQVVLND